MKTNQNYCVLYNNVFKKYMYIKEKRNGNNIL